MDVSVPINLAGGLGFTVEPPGHQFFHDEEDNYSGDVILYRN